VALDQASADAEILQRFMQEAKLTGQLEHPNIVPVYDLSSDEQDRAFYTMKFVQGITLHDILAKLGAEDAATVAQYSLAHLLTIFQKVCDAACLCPLPECHSPRSQAREHHGRRIRRSAGDGLGARESS